MCPHFIIATVDWFQGYGNEIKKNPVYRTSTSDYGYVLLQNKFGSIHFSSFNCSAKPPSVHTMPTKFSGRSQKFTGVCHFNDNKESY